MVRARLKCRTHAQQRGTADETKAKLAVGPGFLKSGHLELATKTFTQVLDADATDWQGPRPARNRLSLPAQVEPGWNPNHRWSVFAT
jgi:hypothetical protein